MRAVVGSLLLILEMFLPAVSDASTLCGFSERLIQTNLALLRTDWNSFDREKIRKAWPAEFEDVFCAEGHCAGLSFTKTEGDCACGATFYFDDNGKLGTVNLVHTVPKWTAALHTARDFITSLKPLSLLIGYWQSADEGWDSPETDQKYVRYFTWPENQSAPGVDTSVSKEIKSVQLTIHKCNSGKWLINLFLMRPGFF